MDLKHEFLCQFGSDDVMEIPPPYSKRVLMAMVMVADGYGGETWSS